MTARHKIGKKIYTTAKYKYGFVTIVLEPPTMSPTPEFEAAIKNAMANTKSRNEKNDDLTKVFDKYGHSFPTEMILGGLLETTESITTTAEVQCFRDDSCIDSS